MRKTIKKTVAICLALTMMAALAGCSSDSSETTAAATEAPETTAEATEAETETTAEQTEAETEAAVEIDYRDIDVDALVAGGANIVYATTYGVYNMEGESPDSSIKADVYYDLDSEDVVYIEFEEALLPYSAGGASGWGVLDEDTVSALGDDVIALESATYPMYFEVGGVQWTGAEDGNGGIAYTAEIDGEEVDFLSYVSTAEGGAWYHDSMGDGAALLTADGEEAATVEIGTKASINHGVDFWPSSITFPGNLELIKNYVYDNGVNYDYAPDGDDIAQNEDGQWVVADVVTGATLAGTPNYLNLVKEAVDEIAAGNYTTVE